MVKIITSFHTLMFYASELAAAIKNEYPPNVIDAPSEWKVATA